MCVCVCAGIRHAFLNFTASNSFVMCIFVSDFYIANTPADEEKQKKNNGISISPEKSINVSYAYGMRNKTSF